MKQFAIYPRGDHFNLHTPDAEIVRCDTYHQAAVIANTYVKEMNLRWWTDWTVLKPIGGRLRYVRNAIVLPHRN